MPPESPTLRFGWSSLRRRGWLIIATALAVGALAYEVAGSVKQDYTAEAILVVPSGATRTTPGAANDASSLAVTYAGIISADSRIQEYVARKLGATPSEVKGSASVSTVNNTSLMRVRYRASTPAGAVRGANLFVQALQRSKKLRVAPTIPAGALKVVHRPLLPALTRPPRTPALLAGLAFGLLLGLMLLLAWERADPRIDDEEALESELGVPATAERRVSARSIEALLQRWHERGRGARTRVAVLPLRPRDTRYAIKFGERVEELATERGWTVRRVDALDVEPPVEGEDRFRHLAQAPGLTLVEGGAPRSAEAGEAASARSDWTVIVTRPGVRVRDARRAAATLEQFGGHLDWAVLARRRRRLGIGRGKGGGDPEGDGGADDGADSHSLEGDAPSGEGDAPSGEEDAPSGEEDAPSGEEDAPSERVPASAEQK